MPKRLLFVDDEVMVLNGLRRALHGMRGEWEMTFVESAAAALQALEQQSYDAIVTDMRMPIWGDRTTDCLFREMQEGRSGGELYSWVAARSRQGGPAGGDAPRVPSHSGFGGNRSRWRRRAGT
jgi:CheY-like chemotaxis protein